MQHADFNQFVDGFNRLAKLDLDIGEAVDPDAAMARLMSYSAHVAVGPEIVQSVAHQIALLTFVNIASRFALGGVTVWSIRAGRMSLKRRTVVPSSSSESRWLTISATLPDLSFLIGSALWSQLRRKSMSSWLRTRRFRVIASSASLVVAPH